LATAVLAAAGLAGCGGVNSGTSNSSLSNDPFSSNGGYSAAYGGGAGGAVGQGLSGVTSWDIWTTSARGGKPTFADIVHSTAQLLIVDPAILSEVQPKLNKAVVQVRQGGSRRLVATIDIASIGPGSPGWKSEWVAKDGSFSPQAPGWLTAKASDGSYAVKYWDPAWQALVLDRVRALMSAGFDGIAPEGLDGYMSADRPTASVDMTDLLVKISQEARKTPNAVVVPLGGASLVDALDDKKRPDLLSSIDGIVGVGVFYGGPKPADNDLNPRADLIADLDKLDRADKKVLAFERLTDAGKVTDFQARARSRGYLPDAVPALTGTAVPAAPASKPASWIGPPAPDSDDAPQAPAAPALPSSTTAIPV